MKSIRYIIWAFVPLLTFVFSVYGQNAKQDGHGHAKGKEIRMVAAIGADGVQHVEILGGEYFYEPNHLVVKINLPVELKVKKTEGYVPHDIVVKAPEAGIDFRTDFGSKEPTVIRFTPTKLGKYQMYCEKRFLFFKSHRDRGMEGVIEVVE